MKKKIDWRYVLFFGFIVIYGVLLIVLSLKLNIWEDESYSLNTSSTSLSKVISQSYNFEGQPPFYFLLLAMWRHINSGIFFARLLSVVFIGLSAIYFYKLVRLISGTESARWLVIIFLLNPFTVWAGLEIRLYSFVIFLSITIIYYFFRFDIENKNKDLYLFLVFSLIGVYTQYFFVFEIIALTFSMWVFEGWNVFFKFCLYLVPVVILFVPNLFFLLNEVKMGQIQNTVYDSIDTVSHAPQALVLGLEMIPFNIWVSRGTRVIIVLISLYAYYKLHKKRRLLPGNYFRNINIILITAAVTILLYLTLVPALSLGFQVRYMALALPMFMLVFMFFKVYDLIPRNIIFIGIALYYISLFFLIYQTPIKRYDYGIAAKFIRKVESPQEPILVYTKILLPAFSYYYKGSNSLISLPEYKYDEKYYEENIVDTIGLKQAIKKIYSPTKSYLLMTGCIEGFRDPINMDQKILDECLRSNYNITLDTSFSGQSEKYTLRVRRLEIKKE